MGTKYYGLVLVPTFVLWESWLAYRGDREWRRLPTRLGIIGLGFVVAFFISSPYNFLDPTWGRRTFSNLASIARGAEVQRFDPDSRISYSPGLESWWEAAVFFVDSLRTRRAAGGPLVLGFLFGLGAAIGYRKYRRHALLIAILWTFFLMAAVMVSTFHVSPRHLVGVLPLACVLIWPGLDVIAGLLPLRGPRRDHAALGLGVLLLVLPLMTTVRVNRSLVVPDSRTTAYRWIVDHLPADAGILVEDEGPVLQPSAAAVSRMQAMRRRLPEGPFTIYEDQRLRLLQRFPVPEGRDIWPLGHPWWLPAERTDEALRSDRQFMSMANPVVSRLPRSLEEYRAAGVRYIVVNSYGMNITQANGRATNFPTFTRFYRSLREGAELIHVIDPAVFGGKGPVIWIYDLGIATAAGGGPAAKH
jgi:hypothetical protein